LSIDEILGGFKMKKATKKVLLGLAALLLAAMILAGCLTTSGGDAPGTLTITGIPAEYEGMDVTFSSSSIVPWLVIIASAGKPDGHDRSIRAAITNGKVNLPLYVEIYPLVGTSTTFRGYAGSNTLDIWFSIYDENTTLSVDGSRVVEGSFKSVQFENGVATVKWDDAIKKVYLRSNGAAAAPDTAVATAAVSDTAVIAAVGAIPGPGGATAGLYVGQSTSPESLPAPFTLAKALLWLRSNAADNGAYTIVLDAGETLPPTDLSGLHGAGNIAIAIKTPGTTERVIQLGSDGSLFTIDKRVTLILDGHITLKGRADNREYLAAVGGSGALIMKGNARISDNKGWTGWDGGMHGGGGVYVNGSFTMSDNATVSDNTAGSGGGVYVNSGGSFAMSDNAVVSGNAASESYDSRGGGVFVSDGTFTMSGNATVSNNTTYSSDSRGGHGGGVYIYSGWGTGSFIMSDSAAVSGNTATRTGGGVYVNGSFSMSGNAIVFGNTALYSTTTTTCGGGVYVADGTFTMSGSAAVSGNLASSSNTTSSYGGGVYITSGRGTGNFTMSGSASVSRNTSTCGGGVYADGSFTMSGSASVSGNTASEKGGGVWVKEDSGSFTKTGGIIYGAKDGANSNMVRINSAVQTDKGAAVYADDIHLRETTVTAAQNLTKKGYNYTGQWTD
jgi:hypothetical protein